MDPSGQYRAAGFGSAQRESGQATNQQMAHIVTQSGCDKACQAQVHQGVAGPGQPLRSQRIKAWNTSGREYYSRQDSWTSAVSCLASMRQSMCWISWLIYLISPRSF